MIKFVFVDLDNTILDFNKSENTALKLTLSQMGIHADDSVALAYSQINDSLWKMLEKGKITRSELCVKRFAMLFARINSNADPVDANRHYTETLAQQVFFIDGAEELLKNLSQKYRLFIASNGNAPVQHGRIDRSGIAKYFENIFISQEVGANKPSREFFDLCFEKIEGFDKNQAIIFGDSLTSDIAGGKNAGILTCWYNPEKAAVGDIKPDFTVNSLNGFIKVLDEIQ